MTVQRTVLIANKRGLHARASAKFVTMASGYDAVVTVIKDGHSVTGTSINYTTGGTATAIVATPSGGSGSGAAATTSAAAAARRVFPSRCPR